MSRVDLSAVELELINTVSAIVSERTGVILGERQRGMVQGRMARRMREVGCSTAKDYMQYLAGHKEAEAQQLVSLLTTHHTFFFREFEHFEFLLESALPHLIDLARKDRRKLRFMSAACSKGHEVYTIAMFLKANLPGDVDFEIVGGDICQESVDYAKNGVYRWDEVKTIPASYLSQNWVRGTGKIADFAKVTDRLRKHCRFEILNLVQLPQALGEKFDVVFCRNVFIYFDRDQVRKSASGLIDRLRPDGHLIVGLSESLNGMELPVEWEGPSVYKFIHPTLSRKDVSTAAASAAVSSAPHPAARVPMAPAAPAALAAQQSAAAAVKAPLTMFAIDDSPTVLMLMKKLAQENGFQFIGSAKDGKEALTILTGPNAPTPSVITLDLHMPNMNGLEFLKAFRKTHKTPVVLVSSINREEQSLAQAALAAGANDYVEKPAMDRWKETTSELAAKLRTAAASAKSQTTATIDLTLDKAFASGASSSAGPSAVSGTRTADKRRWVVFTDEKSKSRAADFTKRYSDRVECVIVESASSQAVSDTKASLPKNDVFALSQGLTHLQTKSAERAVLVFGEVSAQMKTAISKYGQKRTLLEENTKAVSTLPELRKHLGDAVDVFPVFSFAYEADRIIKPKESAA